MTVSAADFDTAIETLADNDATLDARTAGLTVKGYQFAHMVDMGLSVDVTAQDAGVDEALFDPTGLIMYIIGLTNKIHQYTLTTAWDPSTATYASKYLDISGQVAAGESMWYSEDGTAFYASSSGGATIYQYTLSTAWDVSTGSYASKSLSVAGEGTGTTNGFVISPDGTKLYQSSVGDIIYQYTLATPWDLSTGSYASKSLNASTESTITQRPMFRDDGLMLWTCDPGLDKVFAYTLTTAWDISTASYSGISYDVLPNMQGQSVENVVRNGELLLIVKSSTDEVQLVACNMMVRGPSA